MFKSVFEMLKAHRRKDMRESILIRDQKPRLLSPDARREFERLRQDFGGDAIGESNAD